jgi:hypothetical protein
VSRTTLNDGDTLTVGRVRFVVNAARNGIKATWSS